MYGGLPTWRCSSCQMSNNTTAKICTACGKTQPDAAAAPSSLLQAASRGGSVTPPPATSSARGVSPSVVVPSAQRRPTDAFLDGAFRHPASPPPFSSGVPASSMGGPSAGGDEAGRRTPPPGPIVGAAAAGGSHPSTSVPSSAANPFSPVPMTPVAQQHYQQQQQSQQRPQQQTTTPPPSFAANNNNNNPASMLRGSDIVGDSATTPRTGSRAGSEVPSRAGVGATPSSTLGVGGSATNGRGRSPVPSFAAAAAAAAGQPHPMEQKMMEQEITFLRNAMGESKTFAKEIEHTVEYLTDLLRRKTIECESLRTLATENYMPVRNAILEQHKTQKKNEKNAQGELKFFQGRIETLYAERTSLMVENKHLKEAVARLEKEMHAAKLVSSRADERSFFNKIMYGDDMEKPPHQIFRVGIASGAVPLMAKLTAMTPRQTGMLRQVGAIAVTNWMLEPEVAVRLHHFGFWSYMQHLMSVLLLQQQANASTLGSSLSEAFKVYSNWLTDPPAPVSNVKNQHYAEKLCQLYENFMQEQGTERDLLLQIHQGNEFNFWESFVQPLFEYFEERERLAGSGNVNKMPSQAAKFRDMEAHGGKLPDVDPSPADVENAPPPPAPPLMGGTDGSPAGSSSPSASRNRKRSSAAAGAAPASGSPTSFAGLGASLSASFPPSAAEQEHNDLLTRIVLMCAKHNPQKLASNDLEKTLQKYPPQVVLQAMVSKYGSEPIGVEREKLLEEIAQLE